VAGGWQAGGRRVADGWQAGGRRVGGTLGAGSGELILHPDSGTGCRATDSGNRLRVRVWFLCGGFDNK
jgi:hypothetical protein